MGVAYDPTHRRVVIFGGEHFPMVFGTTWTWNGTSWVRWSPGQSPSPRDGSGMTYDSTTGHVLLFGGFDGAAETGDTWNWNGSSWTCVAGCV